jgi:hypothetical protein
MATPLQEVKRVMCCNKTKCLQRVQRRSREAFGEDPSSNPYIHFTNSFMRQVVFVKRNFTLLHNIRMELEYQFDVYRGTNSTRAEALYDIIDFGNCNLMSEYSDVISCLFSKYNSKIVKLFVLTLYFKVHGVTL